MEEKKRINIFRIVFAVILVINIILPIILMNCRTELELINYEVYSEYDETSGYSNCEVELIFNKDISSGSATFKFYDVAGDLISTETAYFFESAKTVYDEINYIEGDIDSYEITNVDFDAELGFLDFSYLIFFFVPVTLFLFALSLRLSYKEYSYEEYKILVYAGFSKHYIKVNNEKTDEYISSINYAPIILSCSLVNEIVASNLSPLSKEQLNIIGA